MFVRSSLESNKKLYPWSQFIVDSNGVARGAWQLDEESSAVVVLDKDGRVQWAKDGALTQEEVQHSESRIQERLARSVIQRFTLPVMNVRSGSCSHSMTSG
eukprot:gene24936-29928_t